MKLSPNEIFIGRNIRTPIDFKLKDDKKFRHKSGKNVRRICSNNDSH